MSIETTIIEFTKMHGIGNDYIYIDCLAGYPDDLPQLAIEMSDRHTGVGGDGIITIGPSECADVMMRIFNIDGSEGKMCGNGIRCVGKYVYERGICRRPIITVETLSGIMTLDMDINPETDTVEMVTVDMGAPAVAATASGVEALGEALTLATALDGDLKAVPVSMGNPHAVIFLESIDDIHFDQTGPELERHSEWPDRANIEFAVVRSRSDIDMRVWERGSGETMACGTGACATAVAAIALGLVDNCVTVHLRGGDLEIRWSGSPADAVMMRGSATEVFTGRYPRKNS